VGRLVRRLGRGQGDDAIDHGCGRAGCVRARVCRAADRPHPRAANRACQRQTHAGLPFPAHESRLSPGRRAVARSDPRLVARTCFCGLFPIRTTAPIALTVRRASPPR
jgi:hypothetical protein